MDKIWCRNPSKSEVIGRGGGDEKTRMTTQNRQKSNAKKKFKTGNFRFRLNDHSVQGVTRVISHWVDKSCFIKLQTESSLVYGCYNCAIGV